MKRPKIWIPYQPRLLATIVFTEKLLQEVSCYIRHFMCNLTLNTNPGDLNYDEIVTYKEVRAITDLKELEFMFSFIANLTSF